MGSCGCLWKLRIINGIIIIAICLYRSCVEHNTLHDRKAQLLGTSHKFITVLDESWVGCHTRPDFSVMPSLAVSTTAVTIIQPVHILTGHGVTAGHGDGTPSCTTISLSYGSFRIYTATFKTCSQHSSRRYNRLRCSGEWLKFYKQHNNVSIYI